MLVILAILWFRAFSYINQKKSRKRFLILIATMAFYVLMDCIFIGCHLDSTRPLVAWKIVSFVFYIVYTLLPFAWHLFVRNYVGLTYWKNTWKLELIPLVILLGMVVATPFTGALYEFTDGIYTRGVLYFAYSILNYFYYIEPIADLIVISLRKQQQKEPYMYQAVIISLVPLAGAFINGSVIPQGQIFPFMPFCTVVVAILSFFFMVSLESESLQRKHQAELQSALNIAEEAKEQALEASRVKTTFLSNMSHDIRTPMNAIINLTSLAQKEHDPKIVKEYLDKMEISGKFLLGLINDILDMSRIESGELTLHNENLTRTEFLKTVETVVRPLMDSKNLNFHIELNPGEYTISVDKLRFNQIFFNLLSNAVKFTPDGGDVWLNVENVETENGKLKVKFVVRDNGIGMSEEFQKHLFEPFAQEASEIGNRSKGTGLGLSIVKNLVEAMNGSIEVKSKLGEGSTFTVYLLVDIVARNELVDGVAQEDNTADLNGLNVLLVEDNEINTYVAQIILENAGCVVTTAENGKIAVDTFAQSPVGKFGAILMDVRMPVMDGLEATKQIRALDRADAKTVPIIAMTADAFDEERKRTIDSGMNYHLSKPVDAEKLYEVLRQYAKK